MRIILTKIPAAMTLDQLQPGRTATIVAIEGGPGVQQRLQQIGLHQGDTVSLTSHSAFHGPVLVTISGMQVALGRGVARKITISPTDPDQDREHRPGHGHRHHRGLWRQRH